MPYADLAKRREAQRRRYWAKKGVPYPEINNSQPDQTPSLPEFVPRQEKVAGFGRKPGLFASIRPYLGSFFALVLGVGLGAGVEIGTRKYQIQAKERIEGLLGVKSEPARELTALERSNQSMAGLLDFADQVMRRASASGSA